MDSGALNILLEKPMIEGDRFGKLFDAAVNIGTQSGRSRAYWPCAASLDPRRSMHKLLAKATQFRHDGVNSVNSAEAGLAGLRLYSSARSDGKRRVNRLFVYSEFGNWTILKFVRFAGDTIWL